MGKKTTAAPAVETGDAWLADMQSELKEARGTIDRYARDLAAHPFRTLGSVHAAVAASATISVFAQVVEALTAGKGATEESVLKYARGRVESISSRGAYRSTNPLDEALQAEELRAWCEVLRLHREAR